MQPSATITRNANLRPFIVLAIGLIAVSTGSIFIRFAQNAGASSFVISAWRLGLASLILTPVVLTSHRGELSKLKRGQIALALLGGIFLALHFATWVTSLEYTSVLTSVVLVNTNPLFVALLSPLVLREKLTRGTLIAIIIAMLGGIIVTLFGNSGQAPKHDSALLGAVLAVAGSITVAGYFMVGRRLRATISLIPYIWMTYGAGAITLIAVVILKGDPIGGLSSDAYIAMTLLALVPQLIGHSSLNYALGYLSAAYVSLVVLGEPVISAVLAIIFLKEWPLPLQLVGGTFILVGLFLASREETQKMKTESINLPPTITLID